jgi:predicted RNA binding protein YcfA (HicA-like mRNA interferase family)
MKYRDLIKILEADGWHLQRQGGGSHAVYRHPVKRGSVVVAGGGKMNRDVPEGTKNAIMKQAGLK